MNLTEHFTLAELTHTNVRGAVNAPSDLVITRLRALAENILEPVRLHFVAPVIVHSGYRSPAVNDAVRGSRNSQHLRGEAADFHVVGKDFFTVARYITASLDFDQIILEFCDPSGFGRGWLHCSFVGYKPNRRLVTVAESVKGFVRYRHILATEIPRASA